MGKRNPTGPKSLKSRLTPKQQDARNDKRIVRAERGIFDLFAGTSKAEYYCAGFWGFSSAGASGVSTDIGQKASRVKDPATGVVRGYIPDKPSRDDGDHFREA
jgi:hypothetical protein